MRKDQLNMRAMGFLSNLEELSLNSLAKGVTNTQPLANLRNLRVLHLWDVDIMDSKAWIFTLPKLELVAIWGRNNFCPQEVEELKRRGIYDGVDPVTLVDRLITRQPRKRDT